jgi:hypothetical protein
VLDLGLMEVQVHCDMEDCANFGAAITPNHLRVLTASASAQTRMWLDFKGEAAHNYEYCFD